MPFLTCLSVTTRGKVLYRDRFILQGIGIISLWRTVGLACCVQLLKTAFTYSAPHSLLFPVILDCHCNASFYFPSHRSDTPPDLKKNTIPPLHSTLNFHVHHPGRFAQSNGACFETAESRSMPVAAVTSLYLSEFIDHSAVPLLAQRRRSAASSGAPQSVWPSSVQAAHSVSSQARTIGL